MLATVKKSLVILEWVMLFAFMTNFAIELFSKSVVGSIVIMLIELIFLWVLISERKTHYSPNYKYAKNLIPFSTPLIDIVLIIFTVKGCLEVNEWSLFFILGLSVVAIDLLIWIISKFQTSSEQ